MENSEKTLLKAMDAQKKQQEALAAKKRAHAGRK